MQFNIYYNVEVDNTFYEMLSDTTNLAPIQYKL